MSSPRSIGLLAQNDQEETEMTQDGPPSPFADPDAPCANCGCEARWHDILTRRCLGDSLACRCKNYREPAAQPTG